MRYRLRANARELPLSSDSVHCIVTSPPYNVGIDYGDHYEDLVPWSEYSTMAAEVSREMYRVAAQGCRAWVNIQPAVPFHPQGNRWRMSLLHLWLAALELAGWEYRDTIAWIQDSHDGACQWGSWLQPTAPNQRGGWEAVISVFKGEWARREPSRWKGWRAPREELGGDWGNDLCRNVWRIPPARSDHPAAFPPALVARCIRLSTWPEEVVLDPFVGSGTTIDVAEQLGRIGLGADLNVRRLNPRQAGLFEETGTRVDVVPIAGNYL